MTEFQVDVELAKEVVSQVEGPDSLKKQLWLEIARYLVETKHDVQA